MCGLERAVKTCCSDVIEIRSTSSRFRMDSSFEDARWILDAPLAVIEKRHHCMSLDQSNGIEDSLLIVTLPFRERYPSRGLQRVRHISPTHVASRTRRTTS